MTIDDIDLAKHAVIEASAGTGKTHTIEQLVLRILTETDTKLDKILLVTFTEKATGELKERLRDTLEKTAREQVEHQHKLRRALTEFDQASIFTIHGFCQRLLNDHALEQGGDFRATLASDADLLPMVLRDVQHCLWRSHFGEHLRSVLDRSGFSRTKAEEWERSVLAVAGKYQPRCGHQLLPATPPEWWTAPDADIAGFLQVFTIEAVRRQLQEHKRQRGLQSFDDMIGIVERALDRDANSQADLVLQRLRNRYPFGIVDEFQDTDPLQWKIFCRIFLEGGSSRLFVVGDPKQAIFGFRSADLPTYHKAARAMTNEHGAASFPLKTNWRSDPKLIEALNYVFGKGEWFPEHTQIRYVHVEPPRDEQRQTRITEDQTGRAALTVVDVTDCERPKEAGRQYGRFVAEEIHRLLREGPQPALQFTRKNKPGILKASDICVLVHKRAEARPIVDRLRLLGIRVNFYKPRGFWQTDEVRELEALLVCLSRPEDPASFRKALLTRFFGIRAEDLARGEEPASDHPARQLYEHWLDAADARHWSALFQSMLEKGGLTIKAMQDPDAEQGLAGLKLAVATLEQIGHGENRDLLGLIDYIRGKRQEKESTDAEPAPVDPHDNRVQIMTIHASKGLEFPIVFLAGGFTKSNTLPPVAEYRDDQGFKVFNLKRDAAAGNKMVQEWEDEHRRLFYVAMTRPIFKLYVPLLSGAKYPNVTGPAGSVLMPALERAGLEALDPAVAQVITPSAINTRRRAVEERMASPEPPIGYAGRLFPALAANLDKRRIVVRSFSSMHRQHLTPVGEGTSYGEPDPTVIDETPTATPAEDPLRGPVFGDIVHNVLEAIDFAEVSRAAAPADLLRANTATRLVVDRHVRANVANLRGRGYDDLEQAAREQVAQLVWAALRTPLRHAGCALCQLAPADRIQELEFHYPEASDAARDSAEERFIVGYMDLVFRRDGRYFLVDYKTNRLSGYTAEHLERCMTESNYHDQYKLYLRALDRWMRRALGRVPALGGVYYLFVRGMNGVDDATGVFFQPLQ